MKGDGSKVPRDIQVEGDGFLYKIPIWCEVPATVMAVLRDDDEGRQGQMANRGNLLGDGTYSAQKSSSHVGTSKEGEKFKKIGTCARVT